MHRPEDDFYPTPIGAIRPLFEAESFTKWICDPCCGSGSICKEAIRRGHRAIGMNLRDRGYGLIGFDFLKANFPPAPTLIFNPPFQASNRFIRHALDFNPQFLAVLLPTARLEGQNRYENIYSSRPPARVYQFVNRVIFYAGDTPREEQPGWSDTAFSWFVWERGWKGPHYEGRWIWCDNEA